MKEFNQEKHDFFLLQKNNCICESSLALFILLACKKLGKVAFFTHNIKSMISLKEEIKSYDSNVEVIIFPEFDCSFFANISPTKQILSERIQTLYKVLFSKNTEIIFIGSYESLVTKTITRENLIKRRLSLKKNSSNFYEKIKIFLIENMFERVDFVRNKGEFAIRGDIIDIFSPNEDSPVRILFDLDNIESLSLFDTETQKSKNSINSYDLFPASEIIYNEKSIKNFRQSFRLAGLEEREEFYKSISNNIFLPGSDQFYPILYSDYDSIILFLKEFAFFFENDFDEMYSRYYEKVCDETKGIKNLNIQELKFFQKKTVFLNQIKSIRQLFFIFQAINNQDFNIFSEDIFFSKIKGKNINAIISNLKSKQIDTNVFCSDTIVNKKKISKILDENSITYANHSFLDEKIFYNNEKNVLILNCSIKRSFKITKPNGKKINFLSDSDFFEKIVKKKTVSKKADDNIINEFSKLNLGDFVVHIDHGIGKFNGLISKSINNLDQDFIEIIYQNNDKLLIPVENLELISKFGPNVQNVSLDKLGLQNWQFRKASVKNKINDIAEELVKTAAKRELQKGNKIFFNELEYDSFASEFEFTETSDQIKTINQIENDLMSGKPMDRLVCGDVGFGKTEIAMRAAFMTMSAGYQVAMICPKVLLVNQHFKTFLKRFQKFSYKIEIISRLKNMKERFEIKNQIKDGNINCIIGTHSIFSKDIEFQNLGLIIIDEEQSFGVEQKEKLKKLKPNLHILTLSATPIPRTLQSSIFKIRDISLIKTPPIDRLNVKTFLMIYDDESIKNIINNELKRNGQIFYVTPRISDIDFLQKKIIKIFPELKFSIIHGKLKNSQIEKTYEDFYERKISLLISTAIIESGLDLSNVNTILIDKPYLFGLSQLYQLRGRVGRSSIQGYAYLILERKLKIDENSLNRLRIISKINKLGAGFSIASNDLDLRGGGNIVGSQQSGHIKEVGLELYYKMVNEVISKIKNEPQYELDWSPQINIGFSLKIPETFVLDIDLRMNIYRKISNINEIKELQEIFIDLEDRFGKLPESFRNIYEIMEVKILSKKLKIKKIDDCPSGFVIEFKDQNEDNIDKLLRIAKLNPKKIKLIPNSKLMYITSKTKKMEKINEIKFFLNQLLEN